MAEDKTPTNVVDERLRLERIIKNNIENPRLQEGLLTRYLDFDEFVKGLPTDRAEQLLDYTNKDIAFNLDLFKDEFNKQPPYDWPLSEDLETTFFDYVEPSPIEDARLADIEGWDLDADGNPIDPRNKPEGMSKWKQELSAQYDYLVTADTPANVVDEVVVTRGLSNAEMAIPTNADGNIILYRATTNPNISIVSDFTDIGKAGQAGLGKQNYFAIDEMYAYLYSRPSINKNVYKFETNIKANQVLNLQSPTAKQLEVLSKIGINEKDLKNWVMQITGESKVNTAIQNNLDYLLDNDIKAIGNNLTGPTANVFEYEIVPIITEKTRTEIKPVSQLILDPKWEGTDRILNVENELFQSTQSTQYADKYLPTDVNNKDTKYRPVYYVDEEGIGRKNRDFQFSEQPLENNLVSDNLIEVPTDTPTNVELVEDTYVINTDTPTNVVDDIVVQKTFK